MLLVWPQKREGKSSFKEHVLVFWSSEITDKGDQLVHSIFSVLSCLGKERYSKQNAACTDSSIEEVVMFDCIVWLCLNTQYCTGDDKLYMEWVNTCTCFTI